MGPLNGGNLRGADCLGTPGEARHSGFGFGDLILAKHTAHLGDDRRIPEKANRREVPHRNSLNPNRLGDSMTLDSTARPAASRTGRKNDPTEPALRAPAARVIRLPPPRAVCLPVLAALALAGFGWLDSIRQSPPLLWSILGAAAALLVWTTLVFEPALRQGRVVTLEVAVRKQHYLQACAQGSVLLYWGWYVPDVYKAVPLIVAQLVFAYGVDMLVNWSQRHHYVLGFGPFPVVFSINLFLWFKPEWFYLQFLMVAFGFVAKDWIRWQREGRTVHIFNPSAFTLALFSVALLLTGKSDITWGLNIAITQFYPPHMFLVLFLIGLPGQILFGVTTMTMAAVVTTYLFGILYFAVTGVYFFYDSYIPIAVFLGMHLLFTDPSTSPRTELGRLIFGVLYGLSTVALYYLLWLAKLPTFYDKLLQVPLLNLSVQLIDRAARSNLLRKFDPAALGKSLAPRMRNLAYVSVWTLVFTGMSAARGVGDRHPGQWLPFWQRACAQGRRGSCDFLLARLSAHCEGGSGWACNEVGVLDAHRSALNKNDNQAEMAGAVASLERGCALGFGPACGNVLQAIKGSELQSAPPTLDDYPIILRGSKQAVTDRSPAALYSTACEQGWVDACGRGVQAGKN
jgi:hypothetical protein